MFAEAAVGIRVPGASRIILAWCEGLLRDAVLGAAAAAAAGSTSAARRVGVVVAVLQAVEAAFSAVRSLQQGTGPRVRTRVRVSTYTHWRVSCGRLRVA